MITPPRYVQVAPIELETILLSHKAVRDAAVVAIPDERAGELPLAFVVKEPNVEVDESELVEFVSGKTTSCYFDKCFICVLLGQVSVTKRLYGGVRFVDEIPKNSSGKILKRILKQQLLET